MISTNERTTASPTHEAFYANDIFEKGIGWVVAARFKSRGQRAEVGVFCVNVWCLGVKIAMLDRAPTELYRSQLLAHYFSRYPMTPIAPCCARKLVEGSVQYATRLGFAPHREYKQASRVFGGIKAGDCAEEFPYGKDGKPFYTRGPSETEERALQIVRQLRQRCGEGNFDYLVELGTVEELNQYYGS